MPEKPQFWLLTTDTPAGPFTTAQIHEQLVAGTVTWNARACRVGESEWKPLTELTGLGPNTAKATSETRTSPTPTTSSRKNAEALIGGLILVFGIWFFRSCGTTQKQPDLKDRMKDAINNAIGSSQTK